MSERTRVTCFVSSVAVGLLTAGTAWGLDGDANLDGVVDVRDTEAVESRFGCPVGEGHFACDVADVNRDGAVNPFDLGYVNARLGWGEQTLRIGPMEGLTTAWHAVPADTAVRLGTTLAFRVTASDQATVEWNGAEEVARDGFDSSARCALGQLGPHTVQVTVTGPDGEHLDLSTSLQVVDVPLAHIKLAGISPSVSPLDVDENSSNEETMDYYFGESIASLTETGPGRYVTSVNRTLALAAVGVVPPAFAPLMEWRVDGIPYDMGAVGAAKILGVGAHVVSGGPIAGQQQIHVDTYSVTITGQFEGDIIPEGEPVTFEAVTDPPGYEEHITWLSSTKYGTAVPVLGQGATFTVQFDDTWGPEDGWQWLGVKGDNLAIGQDQKTCLDYSMVSITVTEITDTEITFEAIVEYFNSLPEPVDDPPVSIMITVENPGGAGKKITQIITWVQHDNPAGTCTTMGNGCMGECSQRMGSITRDDIKSSFNVTPVCTRAGTLCVCSVSVLLTKTIPKEQNVPPENDNYSIWMNVDPDDLVKECDEDNNRLSLVFNASTGPGCSVNCTNGDCTNQCDTGQSAQCMCEDGEPICECLG